MGRGLREEQENREGVRKEGGKEAGGWIGSSGGRGGRDGRWVREIWEVGEGEMEGG